MSVPFKAVQPKTDLPLVDTSSGKPTLPWAQYLPLLDALARPGGRRRGRDVDGRRE